MGGAAGDRLLDMVLRLDEAQRAAGVGVTMGEVLDAADALTHLDLGDRSLLRNGLQATLVKRPEDVEVFRELFDRTFTVTPPDRAPRVGAKLDADDEVGGCGHDPGPSTQHDLLGALHHALQAGDEPALRLLAAEAVESFSGIGEQPGGERYFLYRVLRAVDLSNLLVAMMQRVRIESPDATELALRYERDELTERIEAFRRMLAADIRRRLSPPDDRRSGVGLLAPRRLEDLDVLHASTTDLRQLRQAVQPLARKLAQRVAERHRRHRRGRVDVRRTVRRSLGFGGVPMEPAFRRRRPSRPHVVVLCDVSGSMAEFAHFTLMLVHALQAQLSGVRSFVFVDGVAEVTDLLAGAEVDPDPRLLVTRPGVVVNDGHSDYAEAFARFLRLHGSSVTPTTTVLVMGDARTNYRAAGIEPFREICRQARRVYWFNPEPTEEWGREDSALPLFRSACTGAFEVRSLHQLAAAIDAIL